MSNIVITGGFGFLGSYIVRRCKNFGFTPIILERAGSLKTRLQDCEVKSIKYEQLDDEELVESLKLLSPTHLIHVAWQGVDPTSREMENQVIYNIPYSLQTVVLANQIGCKQWIGIGSLTEYGSLESKVDETHLTSPITVYAKSKLATCWASSGLCQTFSIKWSWIRVGSIFGPGDGHKWLIPYVVSTLSKGEIPKLTPSEQKWDYLFITDASDAVLTIAKCEAEGIYNLGSGNSHTIKEIVNYIVEKLGSDIMPEFGAVPYSPNQIMHLEADISKIKADTGWLPKISLLEGLNNTVNSFKKDHTYSYV